MIPSGVGLWVQQLRLLFGAAAAAAVVRWSQYATAVAAVARYSAPVVCRLPRDGVVPTFTQLIINHGIIILSLEPAVYIPAFYLYCLFVVAHEVGLVPLGNCLWPYVVQRKLLSSVQCSTEKLSIDCCRAR